MTEKARLAKERILAGKKAMEAEKSAPVIRFPDEGIKVTQYQGAGKPARGLVTDPMSQLERAANYKVSKRGKSVNLDVEVAQRYSPK